MPDAVHPERVCRGCAGIGIGQHVSPRTIQVIEGVQCYQWRLLAPRLPDRYARVTRHVFRDRCLLHAPFAVVFVWVQELLAKGFAYDETCVPMEAAWACAWCHGSGEPQLSVGTLEAMLRAR